MASNDLVAIAFCLKLSLIKPIDEYLIMNQKYIYVLQKQKIDTDNTQIEEQKE